jgi:hypothetical protein
MPLKLALVVATLLVALLGVGSGIAAWFLAERDGRFGVDGFTSGVALVALNVLLGLAAVRPPQLVSQHFAFLLNGFGRGAFLVVVGLLLAGSHGLFIACWVVYWVLAAVYFALFLTGTPITLDDRGDFKKAPEAAPANAAQPRFASPIADPNSKDIPD